MPASQTAEAIAAQKLDTPAKGSDEPTFTVERLLKEGDVVTGFTIQEVGGAFAGVNPNTEITVGVAKDRIRNWLRAPAAVSETPPVEPTL
jgi:hypothetical protein